MQDMRKNRVDDGSYGNQCDECAQGTEGRMKDKSSDVSDTLKRQLHFFVGKLQLLDFHVSTIATPLVISKIHTQSYTSKYFIIVWYVMDDGRKLLEDWETNFSGIYDNCKVTDWGCEPFSMWHLEGRMVPPFPQVSSGPKRFFFFFGMEPRKKWPFSVAKSSVGPLVFRVQVWIGQFWWKAKSGTHTFDLLDEEDFVEQI